MNKFFDFLGSMLETALFLKGLPILITIIVVLFGVALINKANVSLQVDKEKTILHTDVESTIQKIAQEVVNNNEFTLVIDDSDSYDVSLDYIIKNKNYSLEQYDQLIKEEITKVYNRIKDKEIVNDTLFGEDTIVNSNDICFSINYDDGVFSYFGIAVLKYDMKNKWDESYFYEMNNPIVTQKLWDNVMKNRQQ